MHSKKTWCNTQIRFIESLICLPPAVGWGLQSLQKINVEKGMKNLAAEVRRYHNGAAAHVVAQEGQGSKEGGRGRGEEGPKNRY